MRSIALAGAGLSLVTILVFLGAYTGIGAISMSGAGLMLACALPLLDGVRRLIFPDENADGRTDALVVR